MCGICGIYHYDPADAVERRLLEAMTARLAHRGPNGGGVFVDGNVGLGHRRLSVIDIETGAQPMIDPLTGRVIVYNGEFYNFASVREQLAATGTTFRTRSDTEVILKLANGSVRDWIAPVNGMFAFGLWDPRSRTLTLVRDRFGVKPLYYVRTARGIAFASEIKALVGIDGGIAATPNAAALPEYLAFGHVVEPRTLFGGVSQLPAGHYLQVSPDFSGPRVIRYWDEIDDSCTSHNDAAKASDFNDVLAKAVRLRLVSDVPLGSFNSGGVDSSLVTREVRRQKKNELHTFSMSFTEHSYDESRYATEVAEALGTIHHAEVLEPKQFASLLPAAIWHNDEPLCHANSVHIMHLSAVAQRHVTVVLTGEGADEVFCGYPRLHIARLARALGQARPAVGVTLTRLLSSLSMRRLRRLVETLGNSLPAEIDSHRLLANEDLKLLIGDADYAGPRRELLESIPENQTALEFILEYERRSHLKSILNRLDKMTMAHGLEARAPFMDFELVRWGKWLRSWNKVGPGWQNKRLLKAEAARHFSPGLVYRRKVGFGVPLANWFRDEPLLREMLASLQDPSSFVRTFVDASAVRKLVTEHCVGHVDRTAPLWALLNLELWAKTMLARPQERLPSDGPMA